MKARNSITEELVPLLLGWFSRYARDLPWRLTRDPYAIWVSEIMLQQTQVKTVIPYWDRWMRELPTVHSLAKAKSDRIHKLWEGLGYYTRVRNLQRAAQQIVTQHAGQFPEDFDTILALPGIGRYTAGAICSIAFNQPRPILDGNVIRVLTRVFGITTDPREKKTNAQLWQLAEELVAQAATQDNSTSKRSRPKLLPLLGERAAVRASDKTNSGNSCSCLNQSLMELGALICTPRAPQCNACPLTRLCIARRRGWQEKLPKPSRETATTARRFIAFVVERDGKFLVRQRPDGVVNGHLWEFPNVEVGANGGRARRSACTVARTSKGGAQRTAAPYLKTDFRLNAPKPLYAIKHSITRYRITLQVWRAELAEPSNRVPGHWLTLPQLHKLAFTSAHKKILSRLRKDS